MQSINIANDANPRGPDPIVSMCANKFITYLCKRDEPPLITRGPDDKTWSAAAECVKYCPGKGLSMTGSVVFRFLVRSLIYPLFANVCFARGFYPGACAHFAPKKIEFRPQRRAVYAPPERKWWLFAIART